MNVRRGRSAHEAPSAPRRRLPVGGAAGFFEAHLASKVSRMDGKMVKSRYSMNELSPTAYTFKWEMMGESGWQTIAEGKTTKM
jgi:hypothetical protein